MRKGGFGGWVYGRGEEGDGGDGLVWEEEDGG